MDANTLRSAKVKNAIARSSGTVMASTFDKMEMMVNEFEYYENKSLFFFSQVIGLFYLVFLSVDKNTR